MAGTPQGYNQNPQQPNYPRGPYQGPPQQQPPVGGNYPRGQYPGAPQTGPAPYPQQYPGVQPNPYGHTNPNAGVTPGLVTAGFIMALIPCTSWPAIIMCGVGMADAKKREAGVGLAWAGIIIGICWQVLGTLFWIALNVAEATGSL